MRQSKPSLLRAIHAKNVKEYRKAALKAVKAIISKKEN